MFKADYHLHTNFSGDSTATPDSMIQCGIANGLLQMCFTDHYDPDFPYISAAEEGMFELDTPAYIAAINDYAAKYQSKIKVLHGVELGMQPQLLDFFHEYTANYPFDFIIASSHVCNKLDPYHKEFFEGRTAKQAYRAYFENILEMVTKYNDFDVYGHLDYVVRYCPLADADYHFKDYEELFTQILKTLISKGKGIEINTGGYRTALQNSNPSKEIIKLYHKLGGEIITVGSDAHKPEHIACDFDKAEQILLECGFQNYCVFEKRKPTFLPIR